MTSTLVHRGPEASGLWTEGKAGLGFRRLSIIDLSQDGNQPFENESEDIHLACNGEIYNFQEVRAELRNSGHRFVSNSDCEVALHADEEFGKQFVHRLDGMFAMAIFDWREQRLVLVTDLRKRRNGISREQYWRPDFRPREKWSEARLPTVAGSAA